MSGRWLTPDTPTGVMRCRSVSLNAELMPVFAGALWKLTHASAWEQHGTLTPEDAALMALAMYQSIRDVEGECEVYLGMIAHFTFVPPGINDTWNLCDGAEFLKADYPDYWQALVDSSHDIYWETDATHFKVPDLRDRALFGTDADINEIGGSATHTLTTGEMPAHTHSYNSTGIPGLVVAPGELPVATPGGGAITGSTGGGGAHNNMPPYVKLYPFIRVKP